MHITTGGKNMQRFGLLGRVSPFLIFGVVFFLNLSHVAAQTPKRLTCKAAIEWQITEEAVIRSFDCSRGKFKGRAAMIIKAGLKNASDIPQRFRIRVFLLDKKIGAGHLVPRRGEPPVLAPGKSQTIRIPFLRTKGRTRKMRVVVTTASW